MFLSLTNFCIDNELPREPFQDYQFSRVTKNIEFYTIERKDKYSRKNGRNNLRLTLIDTVGYGDSMEMSSW